MWGRGPPASAADMSEWMRGGQSVESATGLGHWGDVICLFHSWRTLVMSRNSDETESLAVTDRADLKHTTWHWRHWPLNAGQYLDCAQYKPGILQHDRQVKWIYQSGWVPDTSSWKGTMTRVNSPMSGSNKPLRTVWTSSCPSSVDPLETLHSVQTREEGHKKPRPSCYPHAGRVAAVLVLVGLVSSMQHTAQGFGCILHLFLFLRDACVKLHKVIRVLVDVIIRNPPLIKTSSWYLICHFSFLERETRGTEMRQEEVMLDFVVCVNIIWCLKRLHKQTTTHFTNSVLADIFFFFLSSWRIKTKINPAWVMCVQLGCF